jgi:hypothetical protein
MQEEYKEVAELILQARKQEKIKVSDPVLNVDVDYLVKTIKHSFFRKKIFEFFFLANVEHNGKAFKTEEISKSLNLSKKKLYNAIVDFVCEGLLLPMTVHDSRKKSYKMLRQDIWVGVGKRIYGE